MHNGKQFRDAKYLESLFFKETPTATKSQERKIIPSCPQNYAEWV